jgi:hypothetical protein
MPMHMYLSPRLTDSFLDNKCELEGGHVLLN